MMINPNEHRGGGGVSSTLTSIDLLQERFRQLQKMKELRQEKELLRMLSESADRLSSYTPPLPPPINIQDINYNYELLMPSKNLSAMVSRPPHKPHNINDCQLSLSLWPDSQYIIKRAADHPRGIVGSQSNVVLSKSCFADAMLLENSGGGCSDVDTSLRL